MEQDANAQTQSGMLDEATRTLVLDGGVEALELSPEELRAGLGIPSGERIQDYKALKTIGIGGIGTVFAGHEPGLNREVALKLLRPQYRNKPERISDFIREARATAQIDHPNIVPVHRIGVFDDAGVYFTMKKIDGKTLHTILKQLSQNHDSYRRKYTLRRLIEIFISSCNGVAFAHHHGILHCDLKPGNLMIGDYGEVFVVDWGMAHYRPELDRGSSGEKMDLELECELNQSSAIVEAEKKLGGTVAFMPPEQLTGQQQEPTIQADVYALGAILYTILTWQTTPFPADLSAQELMRRAAHSRYLPPRKAANKAQPVPLELEAICLKAMNPDLSIRYRNVEELLHDVQNYLDGFPVKAYSPNWIYRLSKLVRRHPLIPATLTAALLTGGGYYGYTRINTLSQSESLLNLAAYNYAQGRQYMLSAQRTLEQIKEESGKGEADRARGLENRLYREFYEMENSYNSALEFISRMPEEQLDSWRIGQIVRDVFRTQFLVQLKLQDHAGLNSTLRNASGRWRILFQHALGQDAFLRKITAQIKENQGTLEVEVPHNEHWRLTILDQNGEKETQSPLELSAGTHFWTLPAGYYVLRIEVTGKAKFRMPVEVPLATTLKLSLNVPQWIPQNFIFVPGGEYRNVEAGRMRYGIRRLSLPPFLIERHEVTFAQYLEFWRTLPTPELRNRYQAELSGHNLWNSEAELFAPYQPGQPVVGITEEAAEAYAAWLGKKLGLKGRLPTMQEWEKAASGIDGRLYVWGEEYKPGRAFLGDLPEASDSMTAIAPGSYPGDTSVYGVQDLAGNVREFVFEPKQRGKLSAVSGGSFLSPPKLARNGQVNYGGSRGRDIGFRCLLELPETAKD